jgi:outer membrane protein assembly factor BamB
MAGYGSAADPHPACVSSQRRCPRFVIGIRRPGLDAAPTVDTVSCLRLPALAAVATAAVLLVGCGSGAKPTARAAGTLPAPATAWSEAFASAAHTSRTSARGLQTATLAWSRDLGGAVVPGPAVGLDGSILAASNAGVLHALDPATGRDRWTYDGGGSYGSDLSTTPAVLADGTILWPAPGNKLVALSESGAKLWSLQLTGFVLSPAIGSGGRVYVADQAGHVTAVDVGAGTAHRVAWTITTAPDSYGSPALAPDGTIYTTAGSTLYAIQDDGSKASVRWRFSMRTQIEVSAAVAPDGTVVVGTNDAVVYGVSPKGSIAWEAKTTDWSYSSAVVSGGKVYSGDNGGILNVLDAATGTVLAQDLTAPRSSATSSVGVGIWTAPVVDAAGDAYVATAAGHAYGFSPTGAKLWDLKTGGVDSSYPALTGSGLLVFGSSNGTLYAVG